MAKHTPRTIWKPTIQPAWSLFGVSSPPQVEAFSLVRDVDADASQGLALKHIELSATFGISHATAVDNSMMAGGFFGFFKWPKDAATPTAATVDLTNRGSIFGRTQFLVQGSTPRSYKVRLKSARLRLGDALWTFVATLTESDTSLLWECQSIVSWWETQA